MAHCEKCNSILQKNEIDVCDACKKQKLTDAELEKIKPILENLEKETLLDTGMAKLSGGFATTCIFDYDDDYIDIELKWGIQNDCENRVETEQYKINRRTFQLED